jgi:hypothetical protein
VRRTEDNKLELTQYPTEMDSEVGNSARYTAQEARQLITLLQEKLQEIPGNGVE